MKNVIATPLYSSTTGRQTSGGWSAFDDGLYDELTEGSALNAVNPKGYGNDKFEVIDIVVDMVILFHMAAYIILSQDALLEYHLDSRT